MKPTVPLADYLFSRLRQLGVTSIHGVPGDYNLTLLDYVEPAGLHWVGNCNELNAGYAADGYARIKGLGALITTFGVGELSAINAIAGAYTERAAVVHIVGTPSRASQDSRLRIHHTFNDGNYRRFAEIYSQVTVAQASLRDPRTCPDQIDEVLRQCLLQSRPVYIEVPVDLVTASVESTRLAQKISLPQAIPEAGAEKVLELVLDRIYSAKQPLVLADGEIKALGIEKGVQTFVSDTNIPTWTTSFGKGLLNETLPNYHGIYRGRFAEPTTKEFVGGADLVLLFGPHLSSTNTYTFSSIPDPNITISFTDTEIQISTQTFRDISAKYAVSWLLDRLDVSKLKCYRDGSYPNHLPKDSVLSFSEVSGDQPISQDKVWRLISNFLQPGDIILGETGTAGHGCREMSLPAHTYLFTPVTWLSIGYMLPAAQGAALAQRELLTRPQVSHGNNAPARGRTILFIGDGSFQMTVQEVSTIVRENLDVVIFLINNNGYTIERCIHGLKQGYNDISPWRYWLIPSALGASHEAFTARVKTWADLENVLGHEKMIRGGGLRMVEVVMDPEDAPTGHLLAMINKQKSAVDEINGSN